MDNTIIIFASDHGDYLGDHNFIGKGTFFEGSIHVPLIVRPAGGAQPRVYQGLAPLGDVTATMLAAGGCDVPAYMDARPLPVLGLGEVQTREYIFGMLAGGWMAFDGRWKLSKYDTGERLLFDLETDPHEQRNLIADPSARSELARLDAALTQEIMRSVVLSYEDRRVYTIDKSGDLMFGREGWQRPYPYRLG